MGQSKQLRAETQDGGTKGSLTSCILRPPQTRTPTRPSRPNPKYPHRWSLSRDRVPGCPHCHNITRGDGHYSSTFPLGSQKTGQEQVLVSTCSVKRRMRQPYFEESETQKAKCPRGGCEVCAVQSFGQENCPGAPGQGLTTGQIGLGGVVQAGIYKGT